MSKREIIFKAISIETGEWIEGDLVHDAFDGTSKNMEVGIKMPNCYPLEVDPSTVCQFTGLKDSKGVRIFEGDSVEDDTKEPYVVWYEDASFFLQGEDHKMDIMYKSDILTITGNVHNTHNIQEMGG